MQPRRLIPHARTLRSDATDAEQRLWRHLRNRLLGGFKFRRQVPIGPYVADLLCLDSKLVVELDGGQHLEQVAYDAARTRFLEANGYRVLRFWNDDVLLRTDDVLSEILRHLQGFTSPASGRGRAAGAGEGGATE